MTLRISPLRRAGRAFDAMALVKADYLARHIDIQVKGSDALTYLSLIRDGILKTLQTMPQLRFDENVLLRPEMRVDRDEMHLDGEPVWMAYQIIRTAQKNRMTLIPGPDGFMYDVDRILAVTPIPPELRHAAVFISHASDDRSTADALSHEIERAGQSVWYDRDLIGGQQYRSVIEQRIAGVKAVVVIWTEHSIASKWVIDEAQRAHDAGKLVCLREPSLDAKRIPAPFSSNDHIVELGDKKGLQAALDRLGVPK